MEYKSSNVIDLRVEVLRGGGVYTTLQPVTAPEVQMISTSALKMNLRGQFYEPEKEVHWLTDRIRPILTINGTEYPVGLYIGTTPERSSTGGRRTIRLEAYSVLFLADRVTIPSGYTIKAGTNYIGAVQELLLLCGIVPYRAEGTDKTLAADRADWPTGTKVLSVVNELLAEINYNDAWVDALGVVQLTAYRQPSADAVDHVYNRGQYSIILDDTRVTTDYFDKSNVFRAVCSSPDLPKPLVAVVKNDDPNSPYSTVSLGVEIEEYVEVDGVADLVTLQEMVANLRYKSMQTTETIQFETALNPTHTTYDTVALDTGGESGIWSETEWRMVLDASGIMTHRAERVVIT